MVAADCAGVGGRVEIRDWRLEIGDWRLEIGDWRLEVGDWEIGDWRLEIGMEWNDGCDVGATASVRGLSSTMQLSYTLASPTMKEQ